MDSSDTILTAIGLGPLKLSLFGSGNWGSVVGKIVALNAQKAYFLDNNVKMWVHEEKLGDQRLVDIINNEHENKKYLPGIKLPSNLYATSDLMECVASADLLIFAIPHQFMPRIIKEIKLMNKLKKHARAVSLVKGLYLDPLSDSIKLYSQLIEEELNIQCCALSGANVANDVALEQFCESTLGFSVNEMALLWREVFDRPHFKINCIPDVHGVEICGALKNVIALSAGFCDALKVGTNTKAAIIRIGFMEMKSFATQIFENILEETFFDSSGFADVITTCFGGRNVRCAEAFILNRKEKSWEDIEKEMLDGQKLQGTWTCRDVYHVIMKRNLSEFFPLFVITYKIAFEEAKVESMIDIFKVETRRAIRHQNECNPCIMNQSLLANKAQLRNFKN